MRARLGVSLRQAVPVRSCGLDPVSGGIPLSRAAAEVKHVRPNPAGEWSTDHSDVILLSKELQNMYLMGDVFQYEFCSMTAEILMRKYKVFIDKCVKVPAY